MARRGGPDWRTADACHLLISVGQDYHEGEKLRALVGWVNERFTSCHVTVADTLYRHNLTRPDAHQVTARRGCEWIWRNRPILSGLAMPLVLRRWGDWLAHPGYLAARASVDGFLEAEPRFGALVDEHVREVLGRVRARGGEGRADGFREFLVEELACMELFTPLLPAAEVYPGSLGIAMEGCRALPGVPAGLATRRVAVIDFRRRGPT